MATRIWPSPLSDARATCFPGADHAGFLLVESDRRRYDLLAAVLRAPLRHFTDGGAAFEYLLGRGSYADRKRYPLPGAVLLDLDHPGAPALDPAHRPLLPPLSRLIPFILFKSTFTREQLVEAYGNGAVSCVEFPADRAAAERVAEGLRRYWLGCNLPPSGKGKRRDES